MGGAICGGVVSQSQFLKDPDAYMMAFVMPDKQCKQYYTLKTQGKNKEADKLFRKYAISQI